MVDGFFERIVSDQIEHDGFEIIKMTEKMFGSV